MCGVVAIYGHPEAANLAYLGLHALQHRGQESAGVVTTSGDTLHAVRKMGHVADIFDQQTLASLPGTAAIGHVRYTTSGGSLPKNVQPLTAEFLRGSVAIAHNGNLVNADALRDELEEDGAIFSSNSDTEVVLQLLARARQDTITDRLAAALARVSGAYSMVLMVDDTILAVRDPHGFRPLILGELEVRGGTAMVVASETVAFDLIGAKPVRDIEPGEMISIGPDGLSSHRLPVIASPTHCVFEHVYFSRPDSVLDDVAVYTARVAMGEALASEHPAEADLVIPVPDSGVVAAMGYSRASGLPFEMGLIRNHYVGRTFIEPSDEIRHFGVRLKLNAAPGLMAGKRVVVVDDSIVRGTTSRKIIKMVRDAGATKVHMRISSPPVTDPCYYGIDTPNRRELIASQHSVEEVRRYIGADSLGYLSPQGLLESVGGTAGGFCTACFTGDYPVQRPAPSGRRQLRLIEV